MSEQPVIPVICGPTGAGKTSVVLRLSRDLPIEVVSADSRQMIKYLDIGTAKPTRMEQAALHFHLIDLIAPGERYSAFRFIEDADRVIGAILSAGHIPIVVGGTGLYLRALVEGVVEIEQDRPEMRERLEQEMEQSGPEAMHHRLSEIDPLEAARIHPHNKVRVIRALEIWELTGQPKSALAAAGTYKKSKYEYKIYVLQPARERLYEAIDRRVDEMMQSGWLQEVEDMVRRGLGPALRRANVIGYDELMDFVENKCTLSEAVNMIKQNSRRYAKRQMTWFRHQVEGEVVISPDMLETELRKYLRTWPGVIKT